MNNCVQDQLTAHIVEILVQWDLCEQTEHVPVESTVGHIFI